MKADQLLRVRLRDPEIRHEIAQRYVETEVMYQFPLRIISMQNRGQLPNYEASMSKLFASELSQRIAAMNAVGMRGHLVDDPVTGPLPRHYLGAVPATIWGGTSEVQRNVIATRGLELSRGQAHATGSSFSRAAWWFRSWSLSPRRRNLRRRNPHHAPGALAGIRVLEFPQIVAGPFAGIVLSDFGADVVKVEPLEGDARRNSAAVVPNEGKYFRSLNRGKRSLTLDLTSEGGRRTIHRLVRSFDVVLINYRTGVQRNSASTTTPSRQ